MGCSCNSANANRKKTEDNSNKRPRGNSNNQTRPQTNNELQQHPTTRVNNDNMATVQNAEMSRVVSSIRRNHNSESLVPSNYHINLPRIAEISSVEEDSNLDWRRQNIAGRNSRMNTNRTPIFGNVHQANDSEVRCPECRYDFNNVFELESHLPFCNLVRNHAMSNRIHEILGLMQSLNTRVIGDSHRIFPQILLEAEQVDKLTELIDWEYYVADNGIAIWKNAGKVSLTGRTLLI